MLQVMRKPFFGVSLATKGRTSKLQRRARIVKFWIPKMAIIMHGHRLITAWNAFVVDLCLCCELMVDREDYVRRGLCYITSVIPMTSLLKHI